MEISEIKEVITFLGTFGLGGIVGGGIIYFFIKSFVPKYLEEKAKNLATKEDIEDITHRVESVKSGYAEILEEVKSENQIKISAIEREKSLKKEVYMEAAEAITKAQNIIPSFSNLNMSEETITSGFSSEAGKIAKVQIVGSGQTVKAVTSFMSAIGTATLDLMLRRGPLMQRKNLIAINEDFRGRAQAEVDRYISIMKNLNLQGIVDQAVWAPLNRAAEYEKQLVEKYDKELDELREAQEKEHLEYVQLCMNEFFEISALLPQAVLAVRAELDLHINPEEYLEIYNENIELGRKVFSEFLQKLPNA